MDESGGREAFGAVPVSREDFGAVAKPNVYADVAKSAGQGVVKGILGISDALTHGLASMGMPVIGPLYRSAEAIVNSMGYQNKTHDYLANLYKPQTKPGEYAQSATEGATMGAVMGPAGIIPGLASGVGAQAGGDIGAQLGYPNAGRAVGAVAGGFAPMGIETGIGTVLKPLVGNNAVPAARAAMEGMTAEDFAKAQAMQQQGAGVGVPLSGAESTGNPQLLGMQRTLEQQPSSAPVMSDFYKNRPQQVQTAATNAQAPLGPSPADPALVGSDIQGAAELALKNAEQQRTNSTVQAYALADKTTVKPEAMAGLVDRMNTLIAQDKTGVISKPLTKARDMLVTKDGTITDIDNLDRAKKAIRDMADVKPFGEEAGAKEASKYLKNFAAQLDGIMKTSQPYAQAVSEFAAASPAVQRKIAGTTGALTKTVDPVSQWQRLVDPQLSRPGTITATAEDLMRTNPDNYRKLVKLGIENDINAALKVTQNPGNQAAGARIATSWYSTPQRLDNVREAVAALDNGADALSALDNVMTVLRQTGYRQNTGSPTASNAANVGALGPSSATNFEIHPLRGLGENLDTAFTARSAKNLAKILTDPNSVDLLRKIAAYNPAEPYARAGIIGVLNGLPDKQEPQKSKKTSQAEMQGVRG